MFTLGEKVGFLYEVGGGIIRKIISQNVYMVEDETGFERTFQIDEMVKIHGDNYQLSTSSDLKMNDDETLSIQKHFVLKEKASGSKKSIDVWEIDLHIEEITESHSGLSNFEILTKQLKEFKSFFSRAKLKRIRKIVAIHGVGEGVLKEEIRIFLSKQEGVEYYDADFREYGKGATTAEIHYNGLDE